MGRQRIMVAVAATALTMFGLAGCGQSDRIAAAPVGAVATESPSAQPDPGVEVVVTHERVRKAIKIPFRTVHRKAPSLKKGVTKVARQGRPGLRVKVFRLTLEDGLRVDRRLVNNVVKRKPVTRLVLHGTKAPQPTKRCDPNYSGCVPIASDVDCAGGSGNGPAYAQGPVRVIGNDIYDLDADGDGWGCD
ncbi:G5 domain-containing protein [Nocardioides sp. YIM 152315]|uniref:G5 domain-containing protein n=1 Tax=Nocardioides sp. YIM 152315 TaxID=3031760 RepID=UPI0023D9CC3F|nr:G5 domain-containing protein [Nocardioides sp. YIM 152315]MDF1603725.1 G5 domain-containing protein [Nocardioides sp. YIM 152315]